MTELLGKAEARPSDWSLTASEVFLMVRLAEVLRLTLPAVVLLSGAATAGFLRLARTALEEGHGKRWPEPLVS